MALPGRLILGEKLRTVSEVLGRLIRELGAGEIRALCLACRVLGGSLPLWDLRAAAAPLGGVEIHLDVEDWFLVSVACLNGLF